MVFDTDAHVEESQETFGAFAEDPDLAHLAPQIVVGRNRAHWLIEGNLFPKPAGPGAMTFGTPHFRVSGEEQDTYRKARLESQEMTDVRARLEEMDKEQIDISVVFPTMLLLHPLAEDEKLRKAISRAYNSWMAGKCGGQERLHWVTHVPLPDVAAAIEEIKRAKILGAVGIQLPGTIGELNLDDERFFPFYAAAERLELPICVHVGWSCPPLTNMYTNIYRSVTAPFVIPTFMAFVSFLGSDILDQFPKLKVGFFEAGVEWVPYWLDRLERFYNQPPSSKPKLPGSRPSEYIKSGRVVFSCELDEARISQAAEVIGEDCIVYASDLPHGHRVFNAVQLFRERTDISDSLKSKILADNGLRFFNL